MRNEPAGPNKAAEFLANLPSEAMDVVRTWFSQKATFEGVIPLEDASQHLAALSPDEIAIDEAKLYWRSILCSFCKRESPEALEDFFATPHIKVEVEDPAPQVGDADPAIPSSLVLSRERIDACISVFSAGTETEPAQGDPLAWLMYGLVAAGRKDLKAVEAAKSALCAGTDPESARLAELVTEAAETPDRARAVGLHLRAPITLADAGIFDVEESPVLAIIKSQLPNGRFFARVLGVLVNGRLAMLSTSEAKDLYRETGDVTAFPGNLSANHYLEESALWKVTRKNTESKTQFVITAHHGRVFDVVKIPHHSSDRDGVRIWLQTQSNVKRGHFPFFELEDGMIVRLPGDWTDPATYKFENPLDSFETLNGYALGRDRLGIVVLGPLPAPSGKYDCAPVATLIKRILRSHQNFSLFPAFTNAQIQALVDFSAREEAEPISSSLSLAGSRLSQISDLKNDLTDALGEIMLLPEVVKEVEAGKAKIIEDFKAARVKEESTLERLREQQQQTLNEIKANRKAARQKEVDLGLHLKAAFERAREDGLKTLADVAVLQCLLGTTSSVQTPETPETPSDNLGDQLERVDVGHPITTSLELSNALLRAANSSGLSRQMLISVISGAQSCGAVGLSGSRRGIVVRTLAAVMSGGVYCQVSAGADIFSPGDLLRRPAAVIGDGLRIAMPLGEFLEKQSALGRPSVVELLGANRAPLEAYLPEFLEATIRNDGKLCVPWTDSGGRPRGGMLVGPTFFLLGFISGKSTFSVPEELSRSLPLCALDHEWGDEEIFDSPPRMPNRHLSLEGYCAMSSPNSTDPRKRLAYASSRLGLSDSDASTLASVMLLSGRSGNSVEASEGFAANLQKALAQSSITIDTVPFSQS